MHYNNEHRTFGYYYLKNLKKIVFAIKGDITGNVQNASHHANLLRTDMWFIQFIRRIMRYTIFLYKYAEIIVIIQ